MKTALLCNGPSRVVYQPNLEYNYIIGCNIPWTKVNSTVIMDVGVLEKLKEPYMLFISRKAWIECSNKIKERLIGNISGLFDPLPDYDSAGHAACRKLLELGATEIDIYGCDSWFTNNTESYTHQFVDDRSTDMIKHVTVWRSRWYDLMSKNPTVVFNFIGEPK